MVTKGKFETFVFKSLNESLNNPKFVITDFAKMERPEQLHIAFQAIHKFKETHNRLPLSWSPSDAIEFRNFVKQTIDENKVKTECDDRLMDLFSYLSRGNVAPVNAVIGGCAAQELMKACSGNFIPIYQWLYFDALETLPEEDNYPTEADTKPLNDRYDAQRAVFGETFQQKLGDMKYFLVGAGAIGCEVLKNFALIGLAAGSKGSICITDMDIIERSNLNRQFLFRSTDVGRHKSETAAKAAKAMNPSINIIAHQNRVGPDSQRTYDDEFFERLDGVANALDNVDARIYMDRKCVYYRKPLLESGTLGTKGNVQVVLPFLTADPREETQDPLEKSITICDSENLPYLIKHTLQAKHEFEILFNQNMVYAHQYLTDSNFMERTFKLTSIKALEVLESVKKILIDDKPNNFEEGIKWARNYFEEQYNNQIQQLLYNFPKDQVTSSGAPFWSGPKRCPHPLEFDANNTTHLDYIVSAANLRAFMYSIPQNTDRNAIKTYVSTPEVTNFIPKFGVKIALNDAEMNNENFNRMISVLTTLKSTDLKEVVTKPIKFQEDDDNFHMDYIVAAFNLRAENYGIPYYKVNAYKNIYNKIIPAIATTTSLVTGLVCLELFKLVQGHNKLEPFKNGFVDLALPSFSFSKPMPASKLSNYVTYYSIWDNIEVKGELTLQQFLDYFIENHKLKITWIYYLYNKENIYFQNKKEQLEFKMSEVVRRVSKKRIDPWVRSLVFDLCCDDNGKDVKVPYVRYVLPQ